MDERDYIALNKDLNKMKLKDSTFAIIAEKKDSISHKWFNKNIKKHNKEQHVFWEHKNEYYLYDKGVFIRYTENRPKDVTIYNESEFEALLKAEQENELEPIIGNSMATGINAQTFPKNTVFGKENIAHKHPPLTAKVINDNYSPKPPLGLVPRKTWVYIRENDITQAIARYIEAEKEIPLEWIEELLSLRLNVDKGIIKIEMP